MPRIALILNFQPSDIEVFIGFKREDGVILHADFLQSRTGYIDIPFIHGINKD